MSAAVRAGGTSSAGRRTPAGRQGLCPRWQPALTGPSCSHSWPAFNRRAAVPPPPRLPPCASCSPLPGGSPSPPALCPRAPAPRPAARRAAAGHAAAPQPPPARQLRCTWARTQEGRGMLSTRRGVGCLPSNQADYCQRHSTQLQRWQQPRSHTVPPIHPSAVAMHANNFCLCLEHPNKAALAAHQSSQHR